MEGCCERRNLHTLIFSLATRYAVTAITGACVNMGTKPSIDRPPKQSVHWADPLNLSRAESAEYCPAFVSIGIFPRSEWL